MFMLSPLKSTLTSTMTSTTEITPTTTILTTTTTEQAGNASLTTSIYEDTTTDGPVKFFKNSEIYLDNSDVQTKIPLYIWASRFDIS